MRSLFLDDETVAYVFYPDEPEIDLDRIIYEKLGRDCEELFTEILDNYKNYYEDHDNYEKIAEGYYQELQDVVETLEFMITKSKGKTVQKADLERLLKTIKSNL